MRLVHFSNAELNLNYHIQNVRFLNALIAVQKVFAFVKRDASSAQKTIQLSTTQGKIQRR